MSESLIVTINNVEMPIRECDGKRVVTLADIDKVHERPEGTARRNFNSNKKHLIENEDYIVRNSYEAKKEFGIIAPNGLTLLTETGYLMIVKSFTDDLAWQVQRQLVNSYFEVKQIKQELSNPHIPLSREELAAYMLYTERHTDVIEKMMTSFIDNQTAVQNNTYNSMLRIFTDFTESATVTMNTMKAIAESMSVTMNASSSVQNNILPEQNVNIEEEQWKQSVFDKANRIAKELGKGSGNIVLMKLYNLIKINDGIDLNKYKKEYMKEHHLSSISIISVIAANKELRKLLDNYADKYLSEIIEDTKKEKEIKEKKMPISLAVKRVPDCVLKEIAPLTDIYGHKNSYVLRVVYKEMEKLSGLNLEGLTVLYAEKNHLSSVSKAYVIGHDDQLMRLLKNTVSVLLERGTKK